MTHVLIVDDKEENRYYLGTLLTGYGYSVETASHGAEALFKAKQNLPDLAVSDLLMPVMDGFTLLSQWKADDQLKSVPFVVYTATYTEAEDERLARDLGADAFILKPAEPEDFLARLRQVQTTAAASVASLPRNPEVDEKTLLKVYSETLIRKLEEKTLQLEEANRALHHDIGERKLAEASLQESEERFRATFEHAAVGIAHVGPEGAFLRVNDKFCEIIGYPRDELLLQTYISLTLPEDRKDGDGPRLAMLAGEQSIYSAEKRYQRKNGEVIWMSIVTTLLRGPAGEPKYFISVFTDITERKKLEAQFLRAQRMESLGTLAGGIAHDLNNLLAPIVMGVSLLKGDSTDEQKSQVVEIIGQSASRGTHLVQQILSFSRGVEGARVAVHLGHIIREVGLIIQNTFPKNISLETDIPGDLRLVMSDPTRLNQVLMNLCVNARDSMPNGGILTITARNTDIDEQYAAMNHEGVAGPYVTLEVADQGCGMSKETMDRIFEPFFTTKDLGHGTGLGLSTTVGIVRSHGGFINVYSEPGKGSTFKVNLPVQENLAAAAAAAAIKVGSLPHGQGELILVVDDESAIAKITRQTLEIFGYRVITASDGAEAMGLYAMHQNEIALVLTDMMMPIMDGATLIAALRRMNPDVRVIASSGFNTSNAEERASQMGVKYFLPKPYTAETLLVLLNEILP